jgi:hypothetical protein
MLRIGRTDWAVPKSKQATACTGSAGLELTTIRRAGTARTAPRR